MPSITLFKSLETCCADVDEWPSWTAESPAGSDVDTDKYAQLLDAVNLLRDVRRYRPKPAGWQSLRPVLIERFEEDGACFRSAEQKYRRTLARKSAVTGKSQLSRSGATQPSAKAHRNVTKQSGADADVTVDGGLGDKQTAVQSEPTVAAEHAEHVADSGKDGDDVTKDDSVADDAASDVTIVTSDVDIAEFKLSLDETVEEVKEDIGSGSPSSDLKHLTLDNPNDKSILSVQVPLTDQSLSDIVMSADDCRANMKTEENGLEKEKILNETLSHIFSSSSANTVDVIQPSFQSQKEVDEKENMKCREKSVAWEQSSEMSSEVAEMQTAENVLETAAADECSLQSGAKSSGDLETDVSKYVTSLSASSVNQNMEIGESSETQSLSCKEYIGTSLGEAADAGRSDTVLTTTAETVNTQSLSNSTELTGDLKDEAAVTVNAFEPLQTSVDSADEPSQKLSEESGHEFPSCINDGKDSLQPDTVVNEYATVSSPMPVCRNVDFDDSDEAQFLSCKVVIPQDKEAGAAYSDALLTVTSDSVTIQSLSRCPDLTPDLDMQGIVSGNASLPQQTCSADSTNESPQKETGQVSPPCVNDGTDIVMSEVSEMNAADMLGDSALAECLDNVTDGETSNSISSVSDSNSKAAVSSHLEQTADLEAEKVETVDSMSGLDTARPDTVKLAGDVADMMMPRCFVSLYRMPSLSAAADAAAASPDPGTRSSELHRKCSVVLQRLSPSSLELSSLSLTKSSTQPPCTDEDDRVSVITISSDEDEPPADVSIVKMSTRRRVTTLCSTSSVKQAAKNNTQADVMELLAGDVEYSIVQEEQSSANIMSEECMHETVLEELEQSSASITSQECVDETVPEEISVTETEANHSKVSETQVDERSEFAASSCIWDIQSPMLVNENKAQTDELPHQSESTETALGPQEMADLVSGQPLNYYSDLAADIINDELEQSSANVMSQECVDETVPGEILVTETEADHSKMSETQVDEKSEFAASSFVWDIQSPVVVNENKAQTDELPHQSESTETASGPQEMADLVSGQPLNYFLDLAADIIKDIVVSPAKELDDDQHLTSVLDNDASMDSAVINGPVDNQTIEATESEYSGLAYRDDTEVIEVVVTDSSSVAISPPDIELSTEKHGFVAGDESAMHSDVIESSSVIASDHGCQLHAEEDVAVAESDNEEAETLCDIVIDTATAKVQEGGASSPSAVTVDLPMLHHEEDSTVVDVEDSSSLYSDAAKMDPVERTQTFSVLVSESVIATDSISAESSKVLESGDANTFSDIVMVKTADTLSVLAAESVTIADTVSVVTEDRPVESAGLIDEAVSGSAAHISTDITGPLTSETEHSGNDHSANKWMSCDENSHSEIILCDPFPIFAECRTHSDGVDSFKLSTKLHSEEFRDRRNSDRYVVSCESEIREGVCALIVQSDVPEPADEIDLCTMSASTQSSAEEVDDEDDVITNIKSCTAEQFADTDISNTGGDLSADLLDDMLSRTSNQPVCSHSITTVDSNTCLDSEQLKVDSSAGSICSDNVMDHSTSSLIVADTEVVRVTSELSCLTDAYSSQNTETCDVLQGAQKSTSTAQEQRLHSDDDSACVIDSAVKHGDSAHSDPGSFTPDLASSEKQEHVFRDSSEVSVDETHKEIAAENKSVFFKLDKLSAICRNVHKNTQQTGSESTGWENPPLVTDKPEHHRPDPLPASTSSASHSYCCPYCSLLFFSYSDFISHLRTENQGVGSSATRLTSPPRPLAPMLSKPDHSMMKSPDKDDASVVRSRRRNLSELLALPRGSMENVNRSQATAPVLAATLTEDSVSRTASQEAPLDVEVQHPVPVKSHRSLLTSFAPARCSQKRGSVSGAELDTSATPAPAKTRRSLPESRRKTTAVLSAGRSCKRNTSDVSTGSVVKANATALSTMLTEDSETSAAELPTKLPASELSITKSHHSLPKSRHKTTAVLPAGKSRKRKTSDVSTGSVVNANATVLSAMLTEGSETSAAELPTKLLASELPTTKSRYSLPKSRRKTTAVLLAGKSRKHKTSDVSTGSAVNANATALSTMLTDGSETSAAELPAKLPTSGLPTTKSRRSLPKSSREHTESASSGRSSGRKSSENGTGSRTGKQQDDVTSSQPVAAKSHCRLPKATLSSKLDMSDTSGKQDLEKLVHHEQGKSYSSLLESDKAVLSTSKSKTQKRSTSQNAESNVSSKQIKEDTAKPSQAKSRCSLPKSVVCCQDSSASKSKSRLRRSMPL